MPLEPGETLSNKYEIRALLGKGTITEVYHAYQKALAKDVVVKVLSPHIATDRDLLRRFVSEVEAVARLEVHPNIAWILDLDKDGRWIFFVTDFYPYSLKQMLQEAGKLTPEDAVRVATQVLQALDYAHTHSILHRDIKPQNIMFKEDGTALLSDFGIGEVAREAVQKLKITQMLPTPVYLAPEHIRNPRAIDARADVYSVGAVLYEMLTGQPPFKGDIRTVYSMKFIGRYVPVQKLSPDVPQELAEIVDKAMNKDPAQRYRSAQDFLSEFEEESEDIFYLEKPFHCDMDLPEVKRARMDFPLEVRDDAVLEMKELRFPLVVAPGSVFPVSATLRGHGEFQCALRAHTQGFVILDGPFRDVRLVQNREESALWQVKAPPKNAVGELEIHIYRSGQAVIRQGFLFRVYTALYPRVEKKRR